MNKLLLLTLGLLAVFLIGFVVKETIFFDSNNPYGEKEISPNFDKALPAVEKSAFDPADFGSTNSVPIANEDAKRIASEYLISESKRRGLDQVRFEFVRTRRAADGTIFEFCSIPSGEVAQIRMDRLGALSIVELPTKSEPREPTK